MGGAMSQILPGLYVGGIASARSSTQLDAFNITHLCTVLHYNFESSLKKQKVFIAADNPNEDLSKFFEDASFFIHEARVSGGGVLIHCACGVSRSVTLTLAYLLVLTTLSLNDLLKAVQSARSCAYPNSGFMNQLKQFENSDTRLVLREKLFAQFGLWSQLESDVSILGNLIAQSHELKQLPRMLEERLGSNGISYTIPRTNHSDESVG